MKEKRMQAFTFYASYYDSIVAIEEDEDLSEEAKNKAMLNLFKGICDYMFNENTPEFKGTAKSVFMAIQPNLNSSITKFESGKHGGKVKQKQSKVITEDKQTESEMQTELKQNESETEANQEQYPSNTKTKTKTNIKINNKNKVFLDFSENDEKLIKAFSDFEIMRNRKSKPLTQRASELICMELNKLAPKDKLAQTLILEQSILKGWQDVFPLKDKNFNSNKNCDDESFIEQQAKRMGVDLYAK